MRCCASALFNAGFQTGGCWLVPLLAPCQGRAPSDPVSTIGFGHFHWLYIPKNRIIRTSADAFGYLVKSWTKARKASDTPWEAKLAARVGGKRQSNGQFAYLRDEDGPPNAARKSNNV